MRINDPIPHTPLPHNLNKDECCPLSSHIENYHIFYKGLTKTLSYVCRIVRHDKGKHFLETNNTLKEVLNDKLTNKSAEIQRIRVSFPYMFLCLSLPDRYLNGMSIATFLLHSPMHRETMPAKSPA